MSKNFKDQRGCLGPLNNMIAKLAYTVSLQCQLFQDNTAWWQHNVQFSQAFSSMGLVPLSTVLGNKDDVVSSVPT